MGWKPDKVARDHTTLEYTQGGLKMLNISTVIKSLKIIWIRRLYHATNQPFALFLMKKLQI